MLASSRSLSFVVRGTSAMRALAFGLALTASGAALHAQDLSDILFDGSGGPITPGVHKVLGDITVPAGQTLTLQPGAILKFSSNLRLTASGKLLANGTAPSPVIFTIITDDTAGGDTNADGNGTSPAPGAWLGMLMNAGSAGSVLDHIDVRYTGGFGISAIHVQQPGTDFTLTNSTLRNGSQAGLDGTNQDIHPTVTGCVFTGNLGPAVRNLLLPSLAGFTGNSASGNGGNYMALTNATVAGDVTIASANCLNGSLVMNTDLVVNAGAALHLLPAVHVKLNNNLRVTVNGALDVQGTASGPVVFTSIADDTIDGDTNNDGVSAGVKGAWLGMTVNASPAASTLRHTILRDTGAFGFAGLTSNTALLSAQLVRIEHASAQGFVFSDLASPASDLTAWDCNTGGFVLQGGSFLLKRSTSAFNTGSGFRRTAGYTGTIRSSVSSGNGGGGNFDGFTAGSVLFSDGSAALAGSNGNLNADPLFVNGAGGDFTLQKLSPCVDGGDPADIAFGLDQAGYPRYMDGNLDMNKVIDMGAYEFDHVHLAVTGTFTPGGSLTVATTGTTGLTTYLFIGVVQAEVPLKRFGPLFMDLAFPNVLLGWLPIPSSLPIGIPASLPTPLPVIFQELGIQGTMGSSAGNLSNPVYVTLK